jgi:hypothetical protein
MTFFIAIFGYPYIAIDNFINMTIYSYRYLLVSSSSENYNLGQLRTKLLARQEYSVNHVSYRFSKLKLQSREEDDVTLIDKVSAIGLLQFRGY